MVIVTREPFARIPLTVRGASVSVVAGEAGMPNRRCAIVAAGSPVACRLDDFTDAPCPAAETQVQAFALPAVFSPKLWFVYIHAFS
jgi:hypothetical protein